MIIKRYILSLCLLWVAGFLSACTTNPATGESQFTALLPASQEASIGAQEHEKVKRAFGDFIDGPVAAYVSRVGNTITPHTERKDVQYKFFVVDSKDINAFAIPGGYIYVTRGLLALANSEAELAAVIAHEIGHITGRHSAERASQGFLASLGATILSAAVDVPGIGDAASVGSDLYIKSYSRGQEHQADELGVRYLSRAGYDPYAMARFLQNLQAFTALQERLSGKNGPSFSYFSTHPQTKDRIAEASTEAMQYQGGPARVNREGYFQTINGLVYGDSAQQGFVRDQVFYHPGMGFAFAVPDGFKLKNSPKQVVANHSNGAVILFDSVREKEPTDPLHFLTKVWMKGETLRGAEAITIDGMRAATASFDGRVKNRNMTIRIVTIEWRPGQYFRFQMAIPNNASGAVVEGLKRTTYSFRKMTAADRQVKPLHIQLVTAKAGDTPDSLAARMAVEELKQQQFLVLNGLSANEGLVAGKVYKVVVE